jgi:hypothetical protein
MEIEKYSPNWLLNEIKNAESDTHAFFKIIEFQKALTEQCDHDYSDGTGTGWNVCKKCGDMY